MSKKRKWFDIQPISVWEWFKWDTPPKKLTGWIYKIREEEFVKDDGETIKNQVVYFITEDKEYIRFVIPTDLRLKLENLEKILEAEEKEFDDIILLIAYTEDITTSKGYTIKKFELKGSFEKIPEDYIADVPTLPEIKTEAEMELDDTFDFNL